MLMYTILPLEEIFSEEEEVAVKTVTIDGVQVEVEETKPGWGRIRRLICTDPQVFLEPRWQPGVEIQIFIGHAPRQAGFFAG